MSILDRLVPRGVGGVLLHRTDGGKGGRRTLGPRWRPSRPARATGVTGYPRGAMRISVAMCATLPGDANGPREGARGLGLLIAPSTRGAVSLSGVALRAGLGDSCGSAGMLPGPGRGDRMCGLRIARRLVGAGGLARLRVPGEPGGVLVPVDFAQPTEAIALTGLAGEALDRCLVRLDPKARRSDAVAQGGRCLVAHTRRSFAPRRASRVAADIHRSAGVSMQGLCR